MAGIPQNVKVKLPTLKRDLDKVISDRGVPYPHKHAFIFYFESDDTGAKKDAEILRNTFEDVMGIPSQIYMMPREEKFAQWELQAKIYKFADKFSPKLTGTTRPSLCVFAYAGHGMVHADYGLEFAGAGGAQKVRWRSVYDLLFRGPSLDHVHAFGLLDCCYSGAVRGQFPRTSQVLSACGPSGTANPRGQKITFSQRFRTAVLSLRDKGKKMTSVDEIYGAIQNDQQSRGAHSPVLTHFGNKGTIAFPIKPKGSSAPSHPTPSLKGTPNERTVIVKLTLDGNAPDVTKDFKEFLENLPSNFRAQIIEAYQTDTSALVLVRMTMETWARMSAAVELEIVGVATGQSLMRGLLGAPKRDENIAPRQEGKEASD
ncbi:uncharacterized protein PFLUO_LOCUS7993 [Penicillium psychrofluorescens]|uniref:uncharacterized protein n=1 Tax=Penicillium psychrofluorescens TaxID=3158075 RepID=UPI003CCD47F9